MTAQERKLLNVYRKMTASQRASLIAFSECLLANRQASGELNANHIQLDLYEKKEQVVDAVNVLSHTFDEIELTANTPNGLDTQDHALDGALNELVRLFEIHCRRLEEPN